MVNDEKELDDYLEGNSELSNQYHASAMAVPSERLNDKILSEAKSATDTKRSSKNLFHKSPWVRPVSIAAMITLSVSLVVTMQQETGQPLINVPEPSIEPINATVLSEDMVMPQTVAADSDMIVLDDVEMKKNDDMRVNAPAISGAASGYRADSNANVMKDEAANLPAKKALLKQKVRTKEFEKRVFAEEQMLQSASMEEERDAVMEFKTDRQISLEEDSLLKIKSMWEAGKISEAKEVYQEFYKMHSDFSVARMKEILGPDLYQALNL